jgi:hypothetical protein
VEVVNETERFHDADTLRGKGTRDTRKMIDGGKWYDRDIVPVDEHVQKPYAVKLYEGDAEVFE